MADYIHIDAGFDAFVEVLPAGTDYQIKDWDETILERPSLHISNGRHPGWGATRGSESAGQPRDRVERSPRVSYVFIDPAWGIEQSSYWPAKGPIDNRDVGFSWSGLGEGQWVLDMDAGGVLSIRLLELEPLDGTIPIYRTDDVEKLKSVVGLTCRLGYERDDDRIMEDGRVWIFSWVPMTNTLWQLNAVQRIVHMLMEDVPTGEVLAERERLTKVVQDAADAMYILHA